MEGTPLSPRVVRAGRPLLGFVLLYFLVETFLFWVYNTEESQEAWVGEGMAAGKALRFYRMGFLKKIPSLILKFLSEIILDPWGCLFPFSVWSLWMGWESREVH